MASLAELEPPREITLGFQSLSHPTLYPFLLLLPCVHPKSSLLSYLRQGTHTGLRSVIHRLPTPIWKLPGSPYVRYIQLLLRTFLRSLPVTLHFLVYPDRAFSVCFYNPSCVSDIPTKSSASKHQSRLRIFHHRDSPALLLWLLSSWGGGLSCSTEVNYPAAFSSLVLSTTKKRYRSRLGRSDWLLITFDWWNVG